MANDPRPRLRAHRSALWTRSAEATDLVDTFLVCTVATILVVRLFLVITGYPQLGGDGLHIAHLLWGGLLMLTAMLLTMTLLTRLARWAAAVLGGIGFGLFIDEVGKFVTASNDYFFRPAYSIMYVVLIVIWLVARSLFGRKELTPDEKLANALNTVRESVTRDISDAERDHAVQLVDESGRTDALALRVRELLEDADAVPTPAPGRLTLLVARVTAWYWHLTQRRVFPVVLCAVFVALSALLVWRIVDLLAVLVEAATAPDASLSSVDDAVNGKALGISGWATLVSSAVVLAFYALGLMQFFRRSRLEGYRWLDRGLLVSIFVVQVFDFADLQLVAFGVLAFNLLAFATVRLMMAAELRREGGESQGREDAPRARAEYPLVSGVGTTD